MSIFVNGRYCVRTYLLYSYSCTMCRIWIRLQLRTVIVPLVEPTKTRFAFVSKLSIVLFVCLQNVNLTVPYEGRRRRRRRRRRRQRGERINYIALAIDPFLGPCYCLSIAYCLPLMHICSAIIDIGPGPGPKAQGAYRVY